MRMYGSSSVHLQLFGIGHEIGREIAAVELHAFNEFRALSRGILASSTVITPSLPTFSMAFGEDVGRRFRSPLAEIVRDLCDFVCWRTPSSGMRLCEVLDHRCRDGEVDTALQVHRVHAGSNRLGAPSRTMAVGKNGGGGGAVTRLHRWCFAGDFAQHLCAHVFELVLEFDFLGDSDAILGDTRGTERSSRSPRCGPWGRELSLHRICKRYPRRSEHPRSRASDRRTLLLSQPWLESASLKASVQRFERPSKIRAVGGRGCLFSGPVARPESGGLLELSGSPR